MHKTLGAIHAAAKSGKDRKVASGAKHHEQPGINLEASLPDWCAVGWQQTLVCAAFVVMFTWFSYLPIPVSSTWFDIWQGQRFSTDAFDSTISDIASVPLSNGMRSFKVAGVGQWLIEKVYKFGGAESLSLSFALLQTISAFLWAWLFFKTSQRWWAILLVPVVMVLPWFANGLTTSVFGSILMATTLSLLTRKRDTTSHSDTSLAISTGYWRTLSIAIIFLLWANIDPSFIFGWGVLLCLFISRAIDCVRSGTSVWADQELKARLLLLEVAIVVSVINPQGVGLWRSLFWAPDNPIFLGYGGWNPFVVSGFVGASLAAMLAFWIWCSRRSKSIPTESWVISAFALSLVSLNMSLLTFFALPILWASISLLPLLPGKRTSDDAKLTSQNLPPLRFGLSLVCILMIWLGFAFSPFAHHVLGGQSRSEKQLLGKSSPVAAIEFLKANTNGHSESEFVFCPRIWSHQILANCNSVSVFAVPHQHLTPTQANVDYGIIFSGQNGWRKLLDRYTIDTIVVSKSQQERLIHNLRAKPGEWNRVYEDSVAIVWRKGKTQ